MDRLIKDRLVPIYHFIEGGFLFLFKSEGNKEFVELPVGENMPDGSARHRSYRWIAYTWLIGLYLAGIFSWGFFLNWGAIDFTIHDWDFITGVSAGLLTGCRKIRAATFAHF